MPTDPRWIKVTHYSKNTELWSRIIAHMVSRDAMVVMSNPAMSLFAVFHLVCQYYQVELGHKLVVCKPTSTRLVRLGQKAEMVNFAKSGC